MRSSCHSTGKDSGCRPLLRWAGSKARALPKITPFVPQFSGKYIEPFSGSACLFFNQGFEKAVLGDANQDLMLFYRDAVENTESLYNSFFNINRDKATYYNIRAKYNKIDEGFNRSIYFYYLNRNCFNGIFRTNRKGEFNVPHSSSRVARYLTWEIFEASCARLRQAQLAIGDFETVCKDHTVCGDFIYLDPPYYVPDVRVFREYLTVHFDRDDFERLSETLSEIDLRGAYFLLSYPDCEISRELGSKWNYRKIHTLRTIAASTSSRGKSPELLIANYDIGVKVSM